MEETVKAGFEIIGEMVRRYKFMCFEFPHVIRGWELNLTTLNVVRNKESVGFFLKYFEKTGI